MLNINEFGSLVAYANQSLLGRAPVTIQYSNTCDLSLNAELNDAVIEQAVGVGANIYAIWSRQSYAERWVVMYVGQRSQQFVIERIKQHLFKTPKGTKSKIEQVRTLVQRGYSIGISTILVSPDPIRLSVEDQIIYQNTSSESDLPWNNKSRNVALPCG